MTVDGSCFGGNEQLAAVRSKAVAVECLERDVYKRQVAGLTVARMVQVAIFKKIKPETVLPYSLTLTAIGFCFLMFSPGFALSLIHISVSIWYL